MDAISLTHADPRIAGQSSVKATDSPQKIRDAAQQFEGLLLSQILESVHQDGGWMGSEDSSSGAAMSFAQQQLAGLIAHNGGFGLASVISAGLEQRAPSAEPPSRG